jgi:hypothetical protein
LQGGGRRFEPDQLHSVRVKISGKAGIAGKSSLLTSTRR